MPNLLYTLSPFVPFTKIASSDVNTYFSDIKTLLNTTKLDSTNVQQYGLTRDRLAQTSANHVLINNGSGTMSSEAQAAVSRGGTGQDFSGSLASSPGKAVTVNAAGNAFSLMTPTVDVLTQTPASDIATLTVGEAISANDAVCLALDALSNYRIFKCDSTTPNRRRNFLGFATAAATATPQIQTFVTSANLVASNVISYSINGRSYSTTYATSNDATMTAIAVQMATDPDVQSAAVTGSTPYRTITMTGKGGIPVSITGAVVTLGVSQATITVTTTQSPSGQAVQVRNFGDMSGFVSLTVGAMYYVGTSGAITNTPSDQDALQVGQALSSTILFVNTNVGFYQFGSSDSFVRAHGSTTVETGNGGTATSEHFNYTSWSTGTSDSGSRTASLNGEATINGYLVASGGVNTVPAIISTTRHYNKSTWAAGTARATGYQGSSSGLVSNILIAVNGSTGGGNTGVTANLDAYNGTTWSAAVAAYSDGYFSHCSFTQGGKIRSIAGLSSGATTPDRHDTYNGSSASTDTASGLTSYTPSGSRSGAAGNNGVSGAVGTTTNTKYWNGASWVAASTPGVTLTQSNGATVYAGPGVGFSTQSGSAYSNGGSDSGATTTTATYKFNGTTWSTSTASTQTRNGAEAAAF